MNAKKLNENFMIQLENIFDKNFKIEKKDEQVENGEHFFSGRLFYNDVIFNFQKNNSLVMLSLDFEKDNFKPFFTQDSKYIKKIELENKKNSDNLKKIHDIIPVKYLNSLILFEHYLTNEFNCDTGIKLDIKFEQNKEPHFIIEMYFLDNSIDLMLKLENNQIYLDSIYNGNFYIGELEINNPEVDVLNLINDSFNINLNHSEIGKDVIFSNILEEIISNVKVTEIYNY